MIEKESVHVTDPRSLKEVGRRISNLRRNRNLKQHELANLLHVTPQAVSGWERGINSVNTDILPALADVLDATIDYLLCGKGVLRVVSDERNIQDSYLPEPDQLLVMDEQEYKAYQSNIRQRTQNAPDDIQAMVKKAFETQKPLQDSFRLLVRSYCNAERLEPDSFSFAHVLAIIPCLANQKERDLFAGMLDLDPNIYMMYALAPYVSQDLLGYWAGVCDFCHDIPFAARITPLLAEEDRMLYLERTIYEASSPDIAKYFSDYLTPETITYVMNCPFTVNVALSLFKKLTTAQINELIERCNPEDIPDLSYCLPHDIPEETMQLLLKKCPKDKREKMYGLMYGLEQDYEGETP